MALVRFWAIGLLRDRASWELGWRIAARMWAAQLARSMEGCLQRRSEGLPHLETEEYRELFEDLRNRAKPETSWVFVYFRGRVPRRDWVCFCKVTLFSVSLLQRRKNALRMNEAAIGRWSRRRYVLDAIQDFELQFGFDLGASGHVDPSSEADRTSVGASIDLSFNSA